MADRPCGAEAVDFQIQKSQTVFFEGDGKALLRKDLESVIEAPLKSYTDHKIEEWLESYRVLWQELLVDASNQLAKEISVHKNRRLASLSTNIDPAALKVLYQNLFEVKKQA